MQGRFFFCVHTTRDWLDGAEAAFSYLFVWVSSAGPAALEKIGPGLGHSEITKSVTGPGGRGRG